MTTQSKHPWRATVRTIFAGIVAFAAIWALIVQTLGLNEDWRWVSISLVVTGGVTRVMAIPQVEQFLKDHVGFLAAEPKP